MMRQNNEGDAMIFRTKSQAEAIESELATLEKRRSALAGKLEATIVARDAAIAERRATMIESDDDAALATVEAKIGAAERSGDALRDTLGELDARLADARQRLDAARDAEAREGAAVARDNVAATVEKIAARLEKKVDELSALALELIDAIPAELVDVRNYEEIFGARGVLTPAEVVRAIIAEGLYAKTPDLFEVVGPSFAASVEIRLPVAVRKPDGSLCRSVPVNDDTVRFLPVRDSAEQNIIGPLRRAADEIRAGARSPDVQQQVRDVDMQKAYIAPVFEHARVVFVKPARWRDWRGEVVEQADAAADVPKPVADAAVRAGVAFPQGSREGEAHLEYRFRQGLHHPNVATSQSYVDIAVKWPAQRGEAA